MGTDSTSYLEGGLDVFGTPADGQVPEWAAARSRAEWTTPAGGTPPCAILVQRFGPSNVTVPTASGSLIHFENDRGFDPVYFENKLGVKFPAIGNAVPPALTDSMWSPALDYVISAPVRGLYGFFGIIPWADMPLGNYYFTQVYSSGGPVAGPGIGAREAAGPDNVTVSSARGTTFMDVDDQLFMRAFQYSGSDKDVLVPVSGGPNDEALGPILSMWLIAEG